LTFAVTVKMTKIVIDGKVIQNFVGDAELERLLPDPADRQRLYLAVARQEPFLKGTYVTTKARRGDRTTGFGDQE